ncbi:MAG: aconitate hydratase [Kiritimatiellae bacterium]|jgi:aconitate hydratase|nr:aconitate hydratase [Kiritimatiellia bacterium]
MAQNIVEKILAAHRVSGDLTPGKELAIRIDQTLTQDATGTMAYLQFESMGLDRVKADLAVSYVDHNTIQVGFENADDHAYLKSVAKRYGVVFSRPGNGICHQLNLERFGKPGATLLGSDSHTPTGGGICMLSIGAGGIDVAVAMGGGPFYLTSPKVTLVKLNGTLNAGVSAKDVILKVLSVYGTNGNVGRVLEYGGPGIAALGVPARATITNMGAELGVTTSVFPSDQTTRSFLKAQDREADWTELISDEGAEYEQVLEINMSELEPMAACPHSPGNIATIASLAGKKVDQVLIGSCTNSSYRDLKTVALMLKGKKIHSDVEVSIAPGSRQVVEMLGQEGLLTDLVSAGVRILENACGFCIGNHMSPGTDAVSLRTSNRNFEGRSGTMSAQAYLVSPETAAAAALTGVFADARTLDNLPAEVNEPEHFAIDDSMFLFKDTAGKGIPGTEIVRGPNISDVPAGTPMLQKIDGVIVIKVGDKITTDHIMPAGARLKFRSNIPRYSECVFENVDPDFYTNAVTNRDKGLHNIIVAGLSYGQGSSREHAAMCPMYLGVKAVIAKSIERIHCANLINFGIVPFIFDDPKSYDTIEQSDKLVIEELKISVEGDGKATVCNVTQGTTFAVKTDLSDRQKTILLNGGLLAAVGAGVL